MFRPGRDVPSVSWSSHCHGCAGQDPAALGGRAGEEGQDTAQVGAYSQTVSLDSCSAIFYRAKPSSDGCEVSSPQTWLDRMLLAVLSPFKPSLVLSGLNATVLKAGLAHCQPRQG